MSIFTQEQINEIQKRLALSGIKDTQLPNASTMLKGDELIALVQEGENRKINVRDFLANYSSDTALEILTITESELNFLLENNY